ncbi:HugZ family protein [Ensifer sp. NPDC090286]|uniref:HugZ family pyridoxamine 5'-phosphate oxidase n=1 Tax=Ensifer sp. NPDC090286 TaxID=3363991 RepID=UPI00383AF8CD
MTTKLANPITPRGIEIDPSLGANFDAVDIARNLLRTARVAALATLDPGSDYPYATFTNLAMEPDGTPFFFTAGLALHARNILEDQRVSLAISALRGDLLAHPRLTLVGRAERIGNADREQANRRYLARFPKSKIYLGLGDAMPCRMVVEALHLSGGPARNAAQVTVADLMTDIQGADRLIDVESVEIDKINAQPELVTLLAEAAGAKQDRWRVTGIDPDGLDLSAARSAARLWFPERVTTPQALEEALARFSR